ncbi:MAG: hypothetical protein H6918_08410 [Sphingomonadaceae bacterium]|nr:hypothetical protein [Sphingomonadaceae bacterium]
MMKKAATALALLAMAQAPTAMAQECITEQEFSSMVIYAVPLAVDGMKLKCSSTLAKDGFLATDGDAFRARYAALSDEMWPTAKATIVKMGGEKAQAGLAELNALPDEVVRPLLDAMFSSKIGEEIKPKDCAKVERGLAVLAPINPRDAGALVAFVAAVANVKSAAICKLDV